MSQDTPNSSQQPSQPSSQTLPPQWQPPSQPLPYSPYPQPSPQYPPSQPPMHHPPQLKKTRKPLRRGMKIGCGAIAAIVVLVIIIAIATSGGSKGSTPTTNTQATQPATQNQSTQAPTQIPTSKPTAKPAPTFPQFGDGTYQVGKDIKPGTYRTRVGSPGCYYARLSGFGGSFGEIMANNNTDAPAIVTIAATDKGFQSQNCGTWTEDVSQITQSKTTFGDGMYIIGTDITPGTYRNTSSQGCYYARLSGFGNTTDDIIANNNVDTATIVTIAASDKGFQSNRCGTWTKQS